MDQRAASQSTLPPELISKIPKKSIDDECARLEAIFNEVWDLLKEVYLSLLGKAATRHSPEPIG
jgi:hypothetical protein